MANTTREAMKSAVKLEDFNSAYNTGKKAVEDYVELVQAKEAAKKALDDKLKTVKKSNENYTENDLEKIEAVYNEAIANIEAVTDSTKVSGVQTAEIAKLDAVDALCDAYVTSRKAIDTYITGLKEKPLQGSETEKYITAIQSTIDEEIANIDTLETTDAVTANEKLAKKAIYEATRTSLLQLLEKYETLEASSDDDMILSEDSYKVLKTSKEALKAKLDDAQADSTYAAEGALNTLVVTNFEGTYAKLEKISTVRTKMQTSFDTLSEKTELEKPVQKNQTETDTKIYSALPEIADVLSKVANSISKVTSWAKYEQLSKDSVAKLKTAVDNELAELVDTYVTDKQYDAKETLKRTITQKDKIADKIATYKAALPAAD